MAAAAWLPVLIVVVTPRFRLKPSSDQGTCGKWTIPLLDQGPSSFTWRSPKPIEFGDYGGVVFPSGRPTWPKTLGFIFT